MSLEENKAIARRFFAALDQGQGKLPPEVVTGDMTGHVSGSPQPLTRAEFDQFSQMFFAGFPDLTHTIEEQIAEGEKVVNRLLIRGTHRRSFQGIPATGKTVAMPAITIQRMVEGKVAEQW